jgi:hypothetical protein
LCGFGSQFEHVASLDGSYTVRQGCYDNLACSGTVTVKSVGSSCGFIQPSPSPSPSSYSGLPRSLPSLAQWFDASDVFGDGTVVSSGTPVSLWADKSIVGNSFTQSDEAAQPELSTDDSGRPCVLTSAGDFMTNTYAQLGSGGRTTFIVFHDIDTVHEDVHGNPALLTQGFGEEAGRTWRAGFARTLNALAVNVGGGAKLMYNPSQPFALDTIAIGMWSIPADSRVRDSYLSLNGYPLESILANVETYFGPYLFDSVSSIGTGFSTRFYEYLNFSEELSASDREAVLKYLAKKWSMPVCAESPTIVPGTLSLEDCTAPGVEQVPIVVTNNNAGGCGPEELEVTLTSVPEGWSIVPTECRTFDLNIVADLYPKEISWQVLAVLQRCA